MSAPPAVRQCGRCREHFAVDGDDEGDPPAKWWLCGPCRLTFFGSHPRRGPLTPAETTE
jgi:hypothetical protein